MKKLFILLLLSGCGSKKTITEYKDRIINDTIIKTRTEVLVERLRIYRYTYHKSTL
jgi:hypothetical protein